MRRIGLWLAATVAVVALLFGYHTSTSGVLAASSQTPIVSGPTAGTPPAASQAGSAGSPSSPSATDSPSGTASAKKSATTPATKTYTGSAAQTRYGPVQVAVQVRSGSITRVSVLEYPSSDPRDQQINSYALPILVDQTVKAQSAQVQMVSGATYTSEGYLTSLQSALDQAGL